MRNIKGILGMALTMAMMSEVNFGRENEPRKLEPNQSKYPKGPMPQKGQFHYWFRADGTFLNEKQDARMRKEECVFVCYAINDRNAIKKFNNFNKTK